MSQPERLRSDWKHDLQLLLSMARNRLVVSSPYVTSRGAGFVLSHLPAEIQGTVFFLLLTDLAPINVAQGSTDPEAIRTLAVALPRMRVCHLPRVHSKVYVRDAELAIVTSGNLTAGGLDLNFEYGLKVLNAPTAAAIDRDINDYAGLGAVVPVDALRAYRERAAELRELYKAQQRSLRQADSRFRRAFGAAADELTRLRLASGAMHTVFAATILYVIAKHGSLPTAELHPLIEAMHPDLCDNSVDRVIDGKRFGKKWKHAVRTAQQQLKKRGQIELVEDRWRLV